MLVQDGTLPGQEQWRWDAAGNTLEGSTKKVTHNRLTQLNGIRWRYDVHGRTVEKDNGQTRWHYRYDGEHRLTEVISQPRDRNKPQTQVSFRYDPLGRRISKTRRQMLGGQPTGKPERMTDSEGQVHWEAVNSAWGKLLRESETQLSGYSQNLRMQGQYLDRETGLHYNLFRYYDPDCGRFTQQDPIGLAGGINLYQYAPNALGWVDPWGLSRKCKDPSKEATKWQGPGNDDYPGIDVYKNRKLKKGTILYALYPNGNQQPSYTVTFPTVNQYRGDPLGYHQALQVKLDPRWSVRTKLRAFYVSEDIDVAYGRAAANKLYGDGGGLQFFIPEESRHLLTPGKILDI
ncbi:MULTISPECIES: RHS repeat domain-containing protein [Enterobacter cloacae complex]